MPVSLPRDATIPKVLAEHRALHANITEIENALRSSPHGDPQRWCVDLAVRLGALRQRLERHFASEEQSGFFDEIEELHPEHAHAVRQFLLEHGTLRSGLALVERDARAASSEPRLLADRVRELLRELERHEAHEGEVLASSLEQDGGPGD
jgi:iron-sulfur cluster repair protein YtfE (RIC family)